MTIDRMSIAPPPREVPRERTIIVAEAVVIMMRELAEARVTPMHVMRVLPRVIAMAQIPDMVVLCLATPLPHMGCKACR